MPYRRVIPYCNVSAVVDMNKISDRWNAGEPYKKFNTLSGAVYLYDCQSVDAIDKFFMDECSMDMSAIAFSYAKDFVLFQDELNNRSDLSALDELLTAMVVTSKSCKEYQGEKYGC